MNSFRVISNVKLIASNVCTKKPQAHLLMVFAYAHYTPKSRGTCPKINVFRDHITKNLNQTPVCVKLYYSYEIYSLSYDIYLHNQI